MSAIDLPGIRDVVPLALRAIENGQGAVVAVIVENRSDEPIRPATRLVVTQCGDVVGHIHPQLDQILIRDANESLQMRKSRTRSYRLTGEAGEAVGTQGGDVDVFFEVLARRERLVIVGSGHIAVPLARIAKILEFEVVVLDDRPEYASHDRFPDADQILVGPYADTLAGVEVDPDTYIILVTRGHVHDQASLEQVINSEASYIGMIGSRRRVRTVMAHIKEAGCEVTKLQRVYAPIGLDINAQTPAEIALAIMAEIVNVRRGGPGLSLALGERLHV